MMVKIYLLLACVLNEFADCFLSNHGDDDLVQSVGECLKHVTKTEFDLRSHGYVVIPKTFELKEPTDRILENYLRFLFNIKATAVMIAGDDDKDEIRIMRGGILGMRAQNANLAVDELLDVAVTDDVFVQSHITFMRLTDYYVIIIDSFRHYKSKIRQLVRKPSWNARAPMLIYCSAIRDSHLKMMKYPEFILKSLWIYHVMNATLLMHDFKNHSVIMVFSWEPYDPPTRCGEKHQDVGKYIKLYNKCVGGQLVDTAALFPNKVPTNLKGCPIKVVGVIWRPFLNHNDSVDNPGIDREILNVIAERLNFTIELDTSEGFWGDRETNGSWSGVMGALKKGFGEVAIGAIYPDNKIHEDFDSTRSYLQDSYVWVVPRAKEIPHWKNLIIILRPLMWLASLVVYWVCTVIWYLLSKPNFESGIRHKEYVPALLDSLCLQLGISTQSRPKTNSMRIYFTAFCLYGLIWCTVYQTKLITVLTTPIYERQITQINELLKSNLKFGGNEAFKELFNNSIDETEEHFHSNYLNLDIHEVLDHVILHRNLSVLTSKLYVEYLSATTTRYNDKRGVPMFYVLHSNVFSFPVEMVSIKGFVFMERFDFIIKLLKSNGVVRHIYDTFNEFSNRNAAKLVRESGIHDVEKHLALTLDHLQGAFMVLILGHIASLIVFSAEQIVRNKTKKKKIVKRYAVKSVRYLKPNKYQTRHNFIKRTAWYENQNNFDRLKYSK